MECCRALQLHAHIRNRSHFHQPWGDGWGDRATRGVLVEEVLALIFVLMVGDGGSIRFGTRDWEWHVLCAADNRVLPEREDTNHQDTLLPLLNKKFAWRTPGNFGKQRRWEIELLCICICMNATDVRNQLTDFLQRGGQAFSLCCTYRHQI